MSKEYVIEGGRIGLLEDFYEEISRVLIPGQEWGRNRDAFNEILTGCFGTPNEGFTLRWRDSALSRNNLGYAETVRQLELRLERCHPSNRDSIRRELALARSGKGPTVFDWLIAIIKEHGPGATHAQDNVHLILV
jgi:RNAse (barnase) inhibitor barstar